MQATTGPSSIPSLRGCVSRICRAWDMVTASFEPSTHYDGRRANALADGRRFADSQDLAPTRRPAERGGNHDDSGRENTGDSPGTVPGYLIEIRGRGTR